MTKGSATIRASTAIALLFASQAARAQAGSPTPPIPPPSSEPAQADGLGDVIVTARKVNESLQSTPIAVTAIGAQELQQRQVQSVADLAQIVPSLHVTGGSAGSSSNAQFFIRGVGQSDFLPTTDPAVGVYIDGVYIARTTGNLFDLADVQQIEVLRGPQGTLFGKNTSGGAVSVTTKRPTGQREGIAEVALGSYWRHDGKLSFATPLVADQLAGSLTLVSRNSDGYGHDLYNGRDLGNISMQSVRVALNYYGSSKVDYYLTGDYTRRRERTRPFAIVGIYPSATRSLYQTRVANQAYPGLTYGPAFVAADPLDVYTNAPDNNDLDVGGVSGIGTLHLTDTVSLKSITAWRAQRAVADVDYDGSPLPIADYQRIIHQNQVSQELQLNVAAFDNRLNLVTGAFYQHENATIDNNQPSFPGFYQSLVATNPAQTPFAIVAHVRQGDDSYAGYANATLKLTSRLGLTAGVRYSHETKDFRENAYYPDNGRSIFVTTARTPLPADAVLATNRTFNSTTPTAGVQYQAARDAFFYFIYAQGFKTGGFDARPLAGLAEPSAFNPETVTSYEVGAKLQFLNRHLRINSALYTMSYNDLQVTATQNVSSGLSVNVTRNAGRARIRGAEVEAVLAPVSGLELTANASFTDARLVAVATGVPFTINDKLVNTPKWVVNLGAQYTQELNDAGRIVYRADYAYTSRVYNELPNTYGYNAAGTGVVANGPYNIPTLQPGYTTVNARIGYTTGNGLWTAAVFSTNLTDKRYRTYGFSSLSLGFSLAYFAPPREVGVSLSRKF